MPMVADTAIINAAIAIPVLLISADTMRTGKRPKIPKKRPNKPFDQFHQQQSQHRRQQTKAEQYQENAGQTQIDAFTGKQWP